MINVRSFFVSSILTITSLSVYAADLISMKQIYNYALKQDISTLKSIKNQLETLDDKGNTALCQAILNEDVKTYNTLIHAEANANANCIKNISQTIYNDFINTLKVKGISGGDVATGSTTATAQGTFLGMGTLGWGITGAVVLGGVAAAAGGGGGGGSGGVPDACAGISCGTNAHCSGGVCSCNTGYEGDADTGCTLITLNCNNGSQTGIKCTCNKGWTGVDCSQPVVCPYTTTECTGGYEETGNTCQSADTIYKQCKEKNCSPYKTSCGDGYDKEQKCLSGTTPYYECTPKTCFGYTKGKCPDNANCLTCVTGETDTYKITTCKDGWIGEDCNTPKSCPSSYTETTCSVGYHLGTNTCQSGTITLTECIADVCSDDFNLSSCPTNANCEVCQSGNIPKYKKIGCQENTIEQNGICYTKLACGFSLKKSCVGSKIFISSSFEYGMCDFLKYFFVFGKSDNKVITFNLY